MHRSPTVLGSLRLDAAFHVVTPQRVLFVPTAANGLTDRAAVVDAYRSQFAGADVLEYDLDAPVGRATSPPSSRWTPW